MDSIDLIRLRAYLDQEAADIARIWQETSPEARQEFLRWASAESPVSEEHPPEWVDFAAKLALFLLQSQVLGD